MSNSKPPIFKGQHTMQTETQSQKIVADIVRKHQHGEADARIEALGAFALAFCALVFTIILFSI
jgi:hypothetical protein